jgi:hypothetical protein
VRLALRVNKERRAQPVRKDRSAQLALKGPLVLKGFQDKMEMLVHKDRREQLGQPGRKDLRDQTGTLVPRELREQPDQPDQLGPQGLPDHKDLEARLIGLAFRSTLLIAGWLVMSTAL